MVGRTGWNFSFEQILSKMLIRQLSSHASQQLDIRLLPKPRVRVNLGVISG